MMDAMLSKGADAPDDRHEEAGADSQGAAVPLAPREQQLDLGGAVQGRRAIPLARKDTQPLADAPLDEDTVPLAPSRALVLSDFAPPRLSPGERLLRMAYRLGVPGPTLAAPFSKPDALRLLATVDTPLGGDRVSGMALRAGHFQIHGAKVPIEEMDFESSSRMTEPFERVIHGFSWLRDLSAAAAREQAVPIAERICSAWLDANHSSKASLGKGAAWEVEHAGKRLLAWLVHAPLVLSDGKQGMRKRMLTAIEQTARWLDRNASRSPDKLGEVAGWAAITAAGLLTPQGKARRLYGEAGLVRALGELVSEDGGVLSRSPLAQMDAIAILTDLKACYDATGRDMPDALHVMRELLVPPLLALRHGDGGLASWHGAGAMRADSVAGLVDASGVRTRPLKDVREWGFQRLTGGKTIVQMDAAPPPKGRHARFGCASTLAFEMSDGADRIIVSCGGAALAGGLVPARIEQGLRATAAHSTLVLDDANSTAVLLHGKLGKGVEIVEVEQRDMDGQAQRLEASHDGYAARFGLIHRRILALRSDGTELRGEDILEPKAKRGKRGKIGFAIRFHLGRGVETRLAEDKRGASLLLPSGTLWQFRLGGDGAGVTCSLEESLWVDGDGRPHAIEQLVVEGMTSRGGGHFPWLLKKMG
ncbi:heparinase II/III family protein [Altererythrobacter sp. GH1-8]|uniref:heparinase II/III family protein n=1 Tax=Altererythrobacter sp. GH1-8 TaxID=3349333 RepID=UPI00374D85B5